jgi:hypothetical protein
VSQHPRRLLSDTSVSWPPGSPALLVRRGSLIDVLPGSALETAYGGAGNLAVLTAQQLVSPDVADKSWLSN